MKSVTCLLLVLSYFCQAQSQAGKPEWLVFSRLSSLLVSQANVGVERFAADDRSMSLEASYQFVLPGSGTRLHRNYFLALMEVSGCEVVARVKRPILKVLYFSPGLSYRYTFASGNFLFRNWQDYRESVNYNLSQTRHMAGIHATVSYLPKGRGSAWEFWLGPVIYLASTSNRYFSAESIAHGKVTGNDIPEIDAWYLRSGFTALPRISAGVAYRYSVTNAIRRGRERAAAPRTDSLRAGYLKFYPLALSIGNVAAAFERLDRGRSFEAQVRMQFPMPGVDEYTQVIRNIAFLRRGIEVLVGRNRVVTNSRNGRAGASGLHLSYSYQHADNIEYWSGGLSGKSWHSAYQISQTRHKAGLFWKKGTFRPDRRVSGEWYFMLGAYVMKTRTVIFDVHGPAEEYVTLMQAGDPGGLFNSNGIGVMPSFKLGLALRTKL